MIKWWKLSPQHKDGDDIRLLVPPRTFIPSIVTLNKYKDVTSVTCDNSVVYFHQHTYYGSISPIVRSVRNRIEMMQEMMWRVLSAPSATVYLAGSTPEKDGNNFKWSVAMGASNYELILDAPWVISSQFSEKKDMFDRVFYDTIKRAERKTRYERTWVV